MFKSLLNRGRAFPFRRVAALRQPHVYWLAAIVLFSLAVNLAFNTWGLPKLWHPDEVVRRVLHMRGMGSLHPHFFAYPSLHLYTVNFLVIEPCEALRGAGTPEYLAQVYRLARCLGAVMGALTVLMVYLLGRDLGGPRAGLWSAFCLAASAGFVGFAHFATVDIPLCFWMTAALYACLRALRGPGWGRFAAAGLLVGLAASTKYMGVLLMAPLLAGAVWASWRDGRSWNARYPAALLGAAAGFLLGTPYALLAFPEFMAEFIKLMIYQPDYVGEGPRGFLPHLANLSNLMGVFLFALGIMGLAWTAWTGARTRSIGRMLVVMTVLLIYLKMGSMHFHPGRYIVVLVPLLAACAGVFIAGVMEQGAHRAARRGVLAAGFLYTLFYLGAGLWQIKYNDRVLARTWLLENIPPESRIEVSPSYTFPFSPAYTNTARMPYFYFKETFDRMYAHPVYRFCRRRFPWLGFKPGPPPGHRGSEPGNTGLDGLLSRKPDYLVLAESNYGRFLDDADGARKNFPLQNRLYHALLDGSTPYRPVADFRYDYSWRWPELEFINTGIVIFKHDEGKPAS
jgi:hypothetical protein